MWRKDNRGISLVEFAVALIVTAVGAIYAAPMYYVVVNNHRATSYTNDLVAALTYARVQAVTRGKATSVCSSDNGARCTATPWANGYIVFTDSGMAGTVDSKDIVLKQKLDRKTRVTITLQGGHYVRFDPSGALVAQERAKQLSDSDTAHAGVWYWLGRLSPLASAQADVVPLPRFASTSVPGVFMICAGRTGRVVKLSLQGSIKTSVTSCR